MTYQVNLQVFQGPFDLLLHLISKREVDIYEVSLATITEDYLDHLKALQDLDLEIATEFLVVAATLIEMKAARLLPGPPVDEEEALALSERDLLIARLLEYRAFKDASAVVAERLEANVGFIGRAAGPGEEFRHLAPDLLARVTPQRFAEIALRVLTPKPVPVLDLSHITPIRITVAEAISTVLRALDERRTMSFRELTGDTTTTLEFVVRFLAVLELVKRGEADVRQSETFGPIQVSRIASGEASREIVVDEYEGSSTTAEGSDR